MSALAHARRKKITNADVRHFPRKHCLGLFHPCAEICAKVGKRIAGHSDLEPQLRAPTFPHMSSSAADFRHWEISDAAVFEDAPGGLVRLRVSTRLCNAEVWLHGAHVTHFQRAGEEPLLFLSAASHFAHGKPIRGGVPVIFPWFGPRAGRSDSPAHGFARTLPWDVEALASDERGNVSLTLRLDSSDATRAHWPHEFILRHRIAFGAKLDMEMEVENSSAAPVEFEEALHTYLSVSDVRNVSVTGLENTAYLDKVDALQRKMEAAEPIRITGETDRIYLNTRTTCVLDDPGLSRRIVVEKSGSDATVVWNPWIAKAKAMSDFGDEEWPAMLCIESANTGESAITLSPGATHTMRATISA